MYTKLATRSISISPLEAPPVGWVELDRRMITLSPEEEAPPPGEWLKLDTQSITLTPKEEVPPEVGWVKLDTQTITLTPPGVPPVPPEDEVEKKFPWTLVLIGGGALIAIVGLATAAR